MPWTRRRILGGLAAAPLALSLPRLQAAEPAPRLLLLLLRGGLDGLAAVPVPGDPHWASIRGELDAREGRVDLGGGFALCADLAPLAPLWEAGELLVAHAVATPYRERSHFDGQDCLDNGAATASAARDGWLYRALAAEGKLDGAVALGRSLPLTLRGEQTVACVDPQGEEVEGDPWIDAVASLWADDPLLSPALEQGVRGRGMTGGGGGARGLRVSGLSQDAAAIAAMLAGAEAPMVATVELGGWDTHARQAVELERRLGDLSEGLLTLRRGLGPAWSKTAVVVVSEFGRTARPNGTGGTDHGTAGVALALGGALRGGRVLGDWPGLGPQALWEGRDLRPTTDTRALLAGLLIEHLGFSESSMATAFPGLGAPLRGLA